MALKLEKGVIPSPGATGVQTTSLLDTGFGQVKALILWTAYTTAELDKNGNARFSFGIGTYRSGIAQQFCSTFFSTDFGASSDTARGQTDAEMA